ncbi:MAG TPA: hypothetical protein VLA50_05745 [Erythrobacter sp.]|nr:hypothetical protein [Erythrobacter sp.]
MAFWDIDLTTRSGAETAADQGGLACFFVSGLTLLGAVVFGGLAGFDTAEGVGTAVVIACSAVIALIAGFRLRAGKGAFWGIAVAALLVFEIISKLATFAIGGIVLNTIFLVMVVQGVRGAWALRGQSGFADDDVEVFE